MGFRQSKTISIVIKSNSRYYKKWTDFVYKSLSDMLKTGNPEDLQYVEKYIQDIKRILNKEQLLGKAA